MVANQAAVAMANSENDEQAQREAHILHYLRTHTDQHLKELAALLASKPDSELLGNTEFEARTIVHRIGAEALQAAIDSRQKKGVPGC